MLPHAPGVRKWIVNESVRKADYPIDLRSLSAGLHAPLHQSL